MLTSTTQQVIKWLNISRLNLSSKLQNWLSTTATHSPEHQIAHTKMVKQALKAVARQNNFSYPSVFADFVAGNNPSCTQCFWENFHRLFPETPWHYVSFCHSCRHFDLYASEAEMLADDPHRY